ncbi:sensor histidine kinase [Corticicoccus populi]|uniref:histidine kinase n=1 Tax=Corticicoccus populi TaxID=1812821 RepID=A0ABW5WZT8_9STAP
MKLGTKIQLYTTVMIAIVVVLINVFVYFSYKHFSLEAELGQLENRAVNIMKQIQDAHADGVSTETVLQSPLLSDGYITVLDETDNQIARVATDARYAQIMGESYSTGQYTDEGIHDDIHFAMVSLPIIWDDGSVKNMQMYENIGFLYDTYEILRWVLAVSTLIIIVITFLLNRIITNIVITPINKLINKMRRTDNTSAYTMLEVNRKDTKELKELSQSFNDMMLDLKAHDENQQAFIMNASHELKTPITVIDSYSQMLKRFGREKEDLLDESIAAISDEAKRMKYLTEQLLSFAKVTHHSEHFKPTEINVVNVVEKITERLEAVYGRKINLSSNKETVKIKVDTDTFDQLIKIFLDNAYKYSNDEITVGIKDKDNTVDIEISDRGIGIPQEDLEHIFTRFYRVDKARARKTGGSGLGLSIAEELAKLNEAEISVSSTPDEGSVFTISFKKSGFKKSGSFEEVDDETNS